MFWKRKLIKWIKSEIKDLELWKSKWRSMEDCQYQYYACENTINAFSTVLFILENNKTPYYDKYKIYKDVE